MERFPLCGLFLTGTGHCCINLLSISFIGLYLLFPFLSWHGCLRENHALHMVARKLMIQRIPEAASLIPAYESHIVAVMETHTITRCTPLDRSCTYLHPRKASGVHRFLVSVPFPGYELTFICDEINRNLFRLYPQISGYILFYPRYLCDNVMLSKIELPSAGVLLCPFLIEVK